MVELRDWLPHTPTLIGLCLHVTKPWACLSILSATPPSARLAAARLEEAWFRTDMVIMGPCVAVKDSCGETGHYNQLAGVFPRIAHCLRQSMAHLHRAILSDRRSQLAAN